MNTDIGLKKSENLIKSEMKRRRSEDKKMELK